ncbi:MAG: response regulator [Fibromonadales bacterium]|nr:response regulator [Fibromonadales bacterium]
MSPSSEKKNSLLLVDDEKSNLEVLLSILSSDYTIYMTKSGPSAIEMAEKYLPDLILLDIIMPDMDGYEVLKALRSSAKTKRIPVIFITGLNSVEDEEKGLDLGAADFIHKPFSAKIVKSRVRIQIQIVNHVSSMLKMHKDLEGMAAVAEAANRAKSDFLAKTSHEIRTPMNAIMGITEILIENENLPEDIEVGLDKIYNSCDMLLSIINDILDFSKIEAGKMDVVPVEYNVASIINDSVHLNIMRIEGKPIEFKLKVDENIPAKLVGDQLRIKQIFNNLLSNAFKYTDSGEVNLSICFKESSLEFSVQDTGYGMTKEQLKKLYDEYSRFNQEHDGGTSKGTGLGMAITQRLIHLMSGKIHVESEPGKGSIFTVRLPQKTVDSEVLGKEVAENLRQFRDSYLPRNKRTKIVRESMPYGSVLIVDDVETNLYVAQSFMKPYKLQIETVLNGRAAINKAKNKVYDIIFMDHMMPGMDGLEATKIIRDSGYTAPIIALSANAIAGQADIFRQNGFDDFISKPINTRQLNTILNKYIRDKHPQQVSVQEPIQQPLPQDPVLVELCIKDTRRTIALLEKLSKENGFEDNLQKFIVNVHGIKSVLNTIGETKLSELALQLENLGREHNIEQITALVPGLLNELRTMLYKFKQKPSENAADEDIGDLRNKLQAIKDMCSDYNRKGALDAIAGIEKCTQETRDVLDKIKECVIHSDFEEAENAANARLAAINGGVI